MPTKLPAFLWADRDGLGGRFGQLVAVDYLRDLGGLDLTGKAAVLKTAARERFGVRVPGPPYPQNPLFYNNLASSRPC